MSSTGQLIKDGLSDRRATQVERVLNSVPHVLWSATPDGQLDFVSDQWASHFGGDTNLMLGGGWQERVHCDDVEQVTRAWTAAIAAGELFQAEYRLHMPDGKYRWISVAAKPEHRADGSVLRWFGSCTDINDRVLAERELRESELLYRSVLEASADCIKIVSLDGRLELMNEPGQRTMDVDDFQRLIGKPWVAFWPDEMRDTVKSAMRAARGGKTARFDGYCPTAKGTPKWWDVVVSPILGEDGEVLKLLSISRDITTERQRCSELLWASEHDSLTQLPNRRAFQNRLQAATIRAMGSDSRVGLLLVDLDHFKHVNDTLGHPAGDTLLKTFAKRLRATVRNEDFVARIGGDEFAIIIENLEDANDLLAIGDAVISRLSLPVRIQQRALSGGASIGGAIFPVHAQTANDLFKLADTALYCLKAEGRGGTTLFESRMREEAQRSASQLSLARLAVTERTVIPHYQAKARLSDGSTCGLEALMRWEHSTRGLQLPETIETAFGDYDLASRIGELVQSRIACDVRSWIRRGVKFGRVSINASPAEFLRDDYAERLLSKLREYEVPPFLIEVEVTEHALMERGTSYVVRALNQLKAAGMRIALDDFGTGCSSLSHLRDFPVDVLKIDKSFVQRMVENSEIAAIVAAVVNLSKSLCIETVAEGVETKLQAEILRGFGCDLAQGYLFGRPIESDAIAAMLGARNAA